MSKDLDSMIKDHRAMQMALEQIKGASSDFALAEGRSLLRPRRLKDFCNAIERLVWSDKEVQGIVVSFMHNVIEALEPRTEEMERKIKAIEELLNDPEAKSSSSL